MPSSITSTKITLSYPLYAADFDPENSHRLLVGGGGGEGRSGVGNKITLLNASKRQELSEIVDISLSPDEDSVTTLAYVKSTDQWGTILAGINSSSAEQERGKNEHLRSFLLELPPVRNASANNGSEKVTEYKGQTKALGKASLFKPSKAPKKETYQRVLRLSRNRKPGSARLGAIATGLASEGEVVLFRADTSRPGRNDIRGRIALEEKEEAADVDIIESGEEGKFQVAYCTDYDIYVTDADYSKEDVTNEPKCIFSIPDVIAKARPKLRFIRFITPKVLLALQNKPGGKGAELLLLEVSGKVTAQRNLSKKIKSATALSVAHLDASSPSEIDQHAIAVAGADTSIMLLTLDRFVSSPKGRVKFRPHSSFPLVHPASMTSLAFSIFNPPTTNWNATPVQYLKLASTSIANTCVVHTLPLAPYPSPPKPSTPARYLLAPPTRSNLAQNTFSTIVAIIAIAIGAFFLQAFTEIRGGVPEYLGAKGWLSEGLHDWIARPYMFEDGYANAAADHFSKSLSDANEAVATPLAAVQSAVVGVQEGKSLRDLLAQRNIGSDTSDNANDGHEILIHDSSLPTSEESLVSAELVHESELGRRELQTKTWEELAEHEKELWKQRLTKAGHWTADEGEAVLKGVLFSGLANIVGGVVHG